MPDRRSLADLRSCSASRSSPCRCWAERPAADDLAPDHIAERYGLFTIIVLGESVLAATTAVQAALDAGGFTAAADRRGDRRPAARVRNVVGVLQGASRIDGAPAVAAGSMIAWGYGHYVVFAAVAALGAGLGVATDLVLDHADLGPVAVAATVAIPICDLSGAVTLLQAGADPGPRMRVAGACVALGIVAASAAVPPPTAAAVAGLAAVVTILLAINVVTARPVTTGGRIGPRRDGRVRPSAAAVR